jgi:hypothetical protein
MRLTIALSRHLLGRPVMHCLAALSLVLGLAAPALAQAGTGSGSGTTGGPAWSALNPQQQQTLAPLQRDWSSLDAGRKQKWLELAARYPGMPADQQARVQQRMSEWARMTPEQRGQARLNFQQAQAVPSPDRQAQWQAYQALPPERKAALAQQAARPPVSPGATSAAAPTRALRSAPLDAQSPKTNVATPAAPQAPRPVGPTVVQTGPGASTRLITAPVATKPLSAQGQPKIDVSAGAVDRTTLLPKRGPQAALPSAPVRPAAPAPVVAAAVPAPSAAAASAP